MAAKDSEIELPAHFELCEQMMATWFEACLAATDQCFRFWMFPFNRPLGDEIAQKGQLDLPGPLERDHEHNLFA